MNINPAHKVKVVPCNAYVNESERKAITKIKNHLIGVQVEDQWMLLTNLAFHTGSTGSRRQPDEIDIVVIGPPGITIVEVKHWSAAWVDRHQEIVEQAAKLVNEKTRRVGTTLRKNVQDLGYVRGVFLVTEEGDKVRKLKGRSSQGIPFYTLAKDLKDAIGLNSSKVLSDKQVETLARMLAPRNVAAANGALKHLGDYTRLELKTPKNQRFHRIYKGVHSSRQDRVLLHFYDFSTNDEPNAKDKAEREFKTLHRLQLHRWAPRIIDSFQDAPGYPGEIKFFTVADPTAPSIEERASDHSWDTKARLEFARNTVHALREFHEVDTDGEPMIHRNLTRKTILIKNDNSPIFTGFEYARRK